MQLPISWMPLSAFSSERMIEMTDQIASVDAGNGGTNAVLARPNGNHKTYYEPSVRAAASGDSLGLGKEWEMDYDYVDWNGHRYVTGDDVIRVTRRGEQLLVIEPVPLHAP